MSWKVLHCNVIIFVTQASIHFRMNPLSLDRPYSSVKQVRQSATLMREFMSLWPWLMIQHKPLPARLPMVQLWLYPIATACVKSHTPPRAIFSPFSQCFCSSCKMQVHSISVLWVRLQQGASVTGCCTLRLDMPYTLMCQKAYHSQLRRSSGNS